MNSYFSAADWAVILLYLAGIIGLGLWFGKDQHNTRDYFLGSKNIPWWGIGVSIVAAETSALTIIVVPGLAYGSDIGLILVVIGYVIARIILAIVLVLVYIPGLMDGGATALFSKAEAAGKLHWLNLAPPPGVSWTKFLLGQPFNLWMGIIGGTVMVMSSHGAEQLIVQRVLACKNVADGRKALALSAVVIFPLFLIFLLTGAMLWVFYQHHAPGIPLPEKQPGIAKNDFIFP